MTEEKILWHHIKTFLPLNKEAALVLLFDELNKRLKNPAFCNDFIQLVRTEDLNNELDMDVIVHILNALGPIKDRLYNWRTFVGEVETIMVERLGEDHARQLLKVMG